jgi:CheY-like chemotaxis protein
MSPMVKSQHKSRNGGLDLARILLVDSELTSRLTLQTVLEAGGYRVDSAESAAEAVSKLDAREYELVLSDLGMEAPEVGLKVLAHARMMDYKPATAIIRTYHSASKKRGSKNASSTVLIEPEDLPDLLGRVADLVSERATRRIERELRHA